MKIFVAVQLRCQVWLFVTPWTAARQASLSFIISWNLLKLMSIELVMPSNHLILCLPLLLVSLIFLTINVFSNESVLHIRWPKYWIFNFSISPSNEYSGLISFRNNWFDLLAVQGTLKSLLQCHSSEASILLHSALFMVRLSAWPKWCLKLCCSYSKYTRMSPCVFLFVTLTFNTCAWVRSYKWDCVFGAHHLYVFYVVWSLWAFPDRSDGNAEDLGLISGSGRSPGGGHGNPLQYSCLENPWTEEPGELESMGSQRVRNNWVA